ncbi:unnamed protein product [Adineta ricciae]|uniref:Uncharacterized protein n=1 Tax=Adineta ricciae TaxID=249248 RepID=A0A815VE51_ADIRI|nr:unnamed protein product [Adineta ricciae]
MVPASGLMSIGSCPLHVIHNSFRRGTTSTQWAIDESVNEMWFRFSCSAAREDFVKVAHSIVDGYARFLHRFVCTRWIEIGMVLERVLEQWNIINEYFLIYLPQSDKTLARNDRFQRITTTLKDKSTLTRFHFILYLYRTIFKKALVWFQQERLLVHLVFGECCNVLRSVLLCFVKEELVANKQGTQLLSISYELQNSQRIDGKIDIGESTRNCLHDLSVSEKAVFYKGAREIYCTITKELIRTLPINNTLLRHLQCLHPLLRKESASRTNILCIARSMPFLFNEDEIDRLGVEWRTYEMADIPDDWIENKTGDEDQSETTIYHPIDTYWHHVFSVKTSTGSPQFVVLTKLVKCLLSLSHGNADVERGFNENRHLVSDERAFLSEQSVNGQRATSAGVKFFADGKPHQVAITSNLLDNVKNAHSRYRKDQEQQEQLRRNKEIADQAAKSAKTQHELLAEQELDLLEKQKQLQIELNHATHLFEEGNQRLKAAIDARNFSEIETSGILIDSGKRKLTNINTEIVQNNDALNQLRKKMKK